MTEAVVAQRNTVSAVGFANPLNLPANAEAAAHVKVYGNNTLLVNGPDYTLTGVGDLGNLDEIPGVNVTIATAVLVAALYSTFTVIHDPPMDQGANLTSGGVLGRLYMAGLDAVMRRMQAFRSYFDRALQLPPSVTGVSITLPTPVARRGLVWNAAATALVNSASDPDTEPLTEAVAQAAAAAASAVTATSQAGIATTQATNAAASAAAAAASAAAAGDLSSVTAFLWPVGAKLEHFGRTAPTNFLAADGSAVSRTTYAALWAVLKLQATVTITIASPGVVTWTAHGLVAGDTVRFTTTGALPTGLAAGTTYYVLAAGLTANTFQLGLTDGGAAINTTGGQSGVHTGINAPYGYGDGTTTFNLPTWNDGRFTRAKGGNAAAQGVLQAQLVGTHGHTASAANGGAHTHTYSAQSRYGANSDPASVFRPSAGDSNGSTPTLTTTSNGDHTHALTVVDHTATENRPANSSVLVCIKY